MYATKSPERSRNHISAITLPDTLNKSNLGHKELNHSQPKHIIMIKLTKKQALDKSTLAIKLIHQIQDGFKYNGGIFMAVHEIEKWQNEVRRLIDDSGRMIP